MNSIADILQEARQRELEQALFYRFLSGDAEAAGEQDTAERLHDLLADEQHHVSRLTARLLELGESPRDVRPRPAAVPPLETWEDEARRREEEEVAWYEAALARVEEVDTATVLAEILASERHHRDALSGKWMSATQGGGAEEMP